MNTQTVNNYTSQKSKTHTNYKFLGSNWAVNISNTKDRCHYFENELTGNGGMLVIENGIVVDFDGFYELPVKVASLLAELGYKFDKYILP